MTHQKFRFEPLPAPATAPTEWDAPQRAALAATHASSLVVGGPGTGKTEVLIESVAARVRSGTPLCRVLVCTHSRPAAQRLRQQIMLRTQSAQVSPQVTTVHGYCWSLLRRLQDPHDELRLLRAPDQEFRLREVLAGGNLADWSPELRAAAPTRGFASQLRAVLARARQMGLDPAELVGEGGDPDDRLAWSQVARFFDEYLTVLDFEQAIDYAELVHRARLLLTDDQAAASVAAELEAIYVDEFAELDRSQVALLADHHRLGVTVHAFADPQQSVFGFRGAEPGLVAEFADWFPGGERIELTTNHRSSAEVCRARASVTARLSQSGAAAGASSSRPGGRVRAFVYDDPAAELRHVADQLRTAHLRDGVAWADMAVIVRSARTELGPISRAFGQYGIPVEVDGDEIALADQLAVRPFLLALQVVLEGCRPDPDQSVRLLTSSLAGFDGVDIRQLGRALRAQARLDPQRAHLTSGELIAELLGDLAPEAAGQTDPLVARALHLAALLQTVRSDLVSGASPHTLLWRLWQSTDLPDRLRATALAGGENGYRADVQLDAMVELFDLASRGAIATGERGLRGFLAEVGAQEIPADTDRESDLRGRGVRVLTAHRAKGEQWRRVFIVGLQEGNWPKLSRRRPLLDAERISPTGVHPAETSPGVVGGERRLFLLAASRASDELSVSASRGNEGEGDRPSRFLAELGVPAQRVSGRPSRPLTMTALVAELRHVASDPHAPLALRQAAAHRLASVSAPAADPERWWGLRPLTPGVPTRPTLRFSGSSLGTLLECPRRWFLQRQVRADTGSSPASSVGQVVHLLAQHSQDAGTDADQLAAELDQAWSRIPFEAQWLSASERVEASAALERLQAWQQAGFGREVLGFEVSFETSVDIDGRSVALVGTVDRLELDPAGRLKIVDLKTGRSVPTKAEVAGQEQLGLYQLAASQGAFEELAPGVRAVGDAELVYLRRQDGATPWPKVLTQPSIDDSPRPAADRPTWVHDRLAEAVQVIEAGRFEARSCSACQFCAFARSCPVQRSGAEVVA